MSAYRYGPGAEIVGTAALMIGIALGCMMAVANAADDSAPAADDGLAASPSRPSVSSSAALSVPGHFELETGYLHARATDGGLRVSFPTRLKYSFTEDVGLLLDQEFAVRQTVPGGPTLRGSGDTGLTLKLKLPQSDKSAPAWGLEAGVVAPTAGSGLGVGKTSGSLNGIFSADAGDLHLDLNLAALWPGEVAVGEARTGWQWAAALSHPVTGDWAAIGEFSGTGRRGTGSTSQFLGAFTYNFTPKLVFDGGATRGLDHAAVRWSLFTGFTKLFD
jgi:hypothetical protein